MHHQPVSGVEVLSARAATRAPRGGRIATGAGDITLPLGSHLVTRFGDTVIEQQEELERLGWEVVVVPANEAWSGSSTTTSPTPATPPSPRQERAWQDASDSV